MKKQILLLTGLLVSSLSLSAAMTATLTKEEQYHYLHNQLALAAINGNADYIKAFLKEGVLKDTHEEYASFHYNENHAPHEVAMGLLQLLEDYFNLKEGTDQAKHKKPMASFREFLELMRLNQQLIRAAKAGDALLVKELLEKGALIDAHDRSMLTTFEWAAIQGNSQVMNTLLDELERAIAFRKTKIDQAYLDYKGMSYEDLVKDIDFRYAELREVNADRQLIVPLFQRDVRNLDEQIGCIEKIDLYCESSSLEKAKSFVGNIAKHLKVDLSRDIVFTFFSAHNNSLRLSLQAIGAQQLTHAPHAIRLDKQEHLDRLLLFAAKTDDELVKALIDEGADVTTVDGVQRTPLHIAAKSDNIRAAKILLRAGAPVDAKDLSGITPLYVNDTPLYVNDGLIGPGVGKLLLESGATLEDDPLYRIHDTDSQEAIKIVLEAGIRRFAPTQREARIALQNVAFLIYFLGIKLNLPFYVIHEIICFAIGKKNNDQGQSIAPEWTQRLKRDLEVLYLYRCNSNKLFPLWAQTIRCIAKDPQEQFRLMSRLGSYLEPFLANDVKRFVCLSIMNKVAEGKRILRNKENKNEILVDNHKLYYDHLDEYLQINSFDEE